MSDAEIYDSYLVPAIFEPWSRELIKRALVWKGDRVLDLATGTGIVACRIAGTGAAVTGLDVDAERLALARKRAEDEGVSVKWIEGTMEALPFRQPAFDLVTCQHGLQFVADKAAAAREMRRVIAPGGRAVVACWQPIEHQGPIKILDDIAAKHFDKRHVLPYSFGDAKALQQLLTAAKFAPVMIETVTRQVRLPDPARLATLAMTSLSGLPAEAISPAIADATAAIAEFVDGDAVVYKTVANIAIARVKT